MDSRKLTPLVKAESIIQRDAIMAALENAQIPAVTPPRDISRKIADTTVDLAYEGYSAVFDGFLIQVEEKDLERACAVAEEVVRAARSASSLATDEKSWMARFYFCSLFAMGFSVLMHVVALGCLVKALRRREPM